MVGTLDGIVFVMLSCVFCICRSYLLCMVCSLIRFWRYFLEIHVAELCLLLMACPLFNHGDPHGRVEVRYVCFRVGREGIVAGSLLVTNVLLVIGSTYSIMVGIGVFDRVFLLMDQFGFVDVIW